MRQDLSKKRGRRHAMTEAATVCVLYKKLFLKILQYSEDNTRVGDFSTGIFL